MKRHLWSASFLAILALSCTGPEGPEGPPGNGVDGLVDPSIQPRVLGTFPPMNSVGPYDQQLPYLRADVRFNKIMDRGSVRHALHFMSIGSTVKADTSSIYSLGDDLYYFYPSDSLH